MNNNVITFLGDIYLPRPFSVKIDFHNFVANLENPITKNTIGSPGKINLKAEENYLLQTFKAKPLALCVANNHIGDYGADGLNDTLSNLETNSVSYFGAGYKKNNCNNPLFVDVSDVKVALLAYVCQSTSPIAVQRKTPGVELIDLVKIKKDIDLSKLNGAERIVISFHWGAEHITKPKLEDIKIARSVIDFGVDLVIGHHAHCIQSHERYNGKYIFYGIGNCMFPDFETDAFFDVVTGLPTGKYKAIQKYWNKTSLLVKYNPNSNKVEVDKLRFSNNELTLYKAGIKLNTNEINVNRGYKKVFQVAYFLGKAKHAFHSWLQSPKLPRYRHLVALINVAKSSEHK